LFSNLGKLPAMLPTCKLVDAPVEKPAFVTSPEFNSHTQLPRGAALVGTSEAKLEAAAAAVEDARQQDAKHLAAAGGGSSSARATRQARLAEAEATDDLEAARTAFASLKEGLRDVMAEAERSQRAVDAAVAAAVAPEARRLLDQAWQFRREFLKCAYSVDAVRSFLANDILEELARLWIFISPANTELSLSIQRDWQAALEALKADPDAALPDQARL
jgi:hypothetical protein